MKSSGLSSLYKDEGWSGGVMARPELDRLRDDAGKALFDAVLINDVDRLARDVTHLGVIKRDLERLGVRVIFRKLPSETSPTHNLMVNILGSFAEFERELIADRTRRGRRHKVEIRKQYLGSNTSYGYRYVPIDRISGREGFLEIVPDEAAVVRQMFDWIDSEGLSARRVLHRLNDLKVRPRNGAASWAKSSVLRILRNQMYAGVWHYNKHQGCEPQTQSRQFRYRKHIKSSVRLRPRSEWLPLELPEALQIVLQAVWKRVQQRLDRNITFSPRNEKRFYLLKGLVRCAGCNARYVGDPCHGRVSYRCHRRCKRCPMISVKLLDETVTQAIEGAMRNPALILEQIARLDETERRLASDNEQTVKDIESETQKIQSEEDRLLEGYRLGVLGPDELGRELEKLRARRNALVSRQVQVAAQEGSEDVAKSVQEYCQEAVQNLEAFSPDEYREFLRSMIREIFFDGEQVRIRGEIPTQYTDRLPVANVADPTAMDRGRIASTRINPYGRNSGRENLCSEPIFPCSFEVEASIVRIPPSVQPRDEYGRFRSVNQNAAGHALSGRNSPQLAA